MSSIRNTSQVSDLKLIRGVTAFFRYIVNGRLLVDLVRWLIHTGGTIAESAFLLATVYVTIDMVAHPLMQLLLSDTIIKMLNQISVIAFSVLPELIIFAAMNVTYDHWRMVLKTKQVNTFVWAICYTIPTTIFLVMTIITISSFVSLEAVNAGTALQATGAMLVTRCLSGWFYGTLQMLFASIGKQGYADILKNATDEKQSVIDEKESTIAFLKSDSAKKQSVIDEKKVSLAQNQSESDTLRAQIALQEQELIDLRVALVSQKVSRNNTTKSDSHTIPRKSDTTRKSDADLFRSDSDSDESDSAITSEKRMKLKERMRDTIIRGDKLNLKKISSDTGVGYTTVRKYADGILQDIASEHPAMERIEIAN